MPRAKHTRHALHRVNTDRERSRAAYEALRVEEQRLKNDVLRPKAMAARLENARLAALLMGIEEEAANMAQSAHIREINAKIRGKIFPGADD